GSRNDRDWDGGRKKGACGDPGCRGRAGGREVSLLLENRTRLLLILSQDMLDQARVIAGRATTVLKLPVSLQIVLRALIGVGLKRESHPALFANIESQAK